MNDGIEPPNEVTGGFCTSGSEREFTREGSWYAMKKHKPEQIVTILRQEVFTNQSEDHEQDWLQVQVKPPTSTKFNRVQQSSTSRPQSIQQQSLRINKNP
jgi:hypothetical protein